MTSHDRLKLMAYRRSKRRVSRLLNSIWGDPPKSKRPASEYVFWVGYVMVVLAMLSVVIGAVTQGLK